jgi:hypothetical protein
MGTPRRTPSGPLPAPPRRNLMLVKDDVMKSLSSMSREDAAEVLRRVALEHDRSPNEGSAAPYVDALSQMQGDRARALIEAAGNPPVFRSVVNTTMDDILDAPPLPAIDAGSLTTEQQQAVSEISSLFEDYERARSQWSSAEQRPFEQSKIAQDINDRITELVVMNDLDKAIDFGNAETVDDLRAQIAPTTGDLPASENAPKIRATRSDFPMEDRLSTYMGERAENYIQKDEPFRGAPSGQLMRLAGVDVNRMLSEAGYSAEQIKQMPADKKYAIVTEFSQTKEGSTSPTSRIRGPSGEVVEITTEGGAASPRAKKIADKQMTLAQLKSMPATQITAADVPAGVSPQQAAAAQSQGRARDIAALEKELNDILSARQYAPGDSVKALRNLNQRLAEIQQLPIDPSRDRFDHVLDRSLNLTTDEINQLPPEAKVAYRDGQINTLEDLMPYLRPEDMDSSGAMVGRAIQAPEFGGSQARETKPLTAKEDEIAVRGAGLSLRQSPYASLLEQIQMRKALPPQDAVDAFSDEGPKSFPDAQSQQSAIAFLKKNIQEMQTRMSRARPPVAPQGRVGEISAHNWGAVPDAPEMRSPANAIAEQWLQASGVTGSDMHGVTRDPETGVMRVEGAQGYYGNPSEQTARKPPGFVYGLYPQVDAEGNVTHPYQPPSGDLAARNLAWTIGTDDPGFAATITPAMQDSIDEHWATLPQAGEAGSGIYKQLKSGEVVRDKFMPNKTGLAFLRAQAGGMAGNNKLNIQTRPQRMDVPSLSLDELEAMDVEGSPPDTPPPMPTKFANALEELDALEAMEAEGDLEQAVPRGTPRGPRSAEDANRMLMELNGLEDIPVEDDDTGFLGQTTMNRLPMRALLSGLMA